MDGPYERIVSGTKTVEIRLFDEKRQKIKLGDIIEFARLSDKATIKAEVIGLLRYNTFKDLLNDFKDEGSETELYKIYSKEQEQKYGVLGIKLNVK